MDERTDAALPACLLVREVRSRRERQGFRTTALILVTTLLEASTHPREASADLSARRWRRELFFDDRKTTLQMDRLRTKSPAMVQRELLLHMNRRQPSAPPHGARGRQRRTRQLQRQHRSPANLAAGDLERPQRAPCHPLPAPPARNHRRCRSPAPPRPPRTARPQTTPQILPTPHPPTPSLP